MDRRKLRARAAMVLLVFVAELFAPILAQASKAAPKIYFKAGSGTYELNYMPPAQLRAGLQAIPGVGPKTADLILRYRAQNGGFATIQDIFQVPGVRKPAAQNVVRRAGRTASPGARAPRPSQAAAKPLPEIKTAPKPKPVPEVWVRTQAGRVNLNHPSAHRVAVELLKGGVSQPQVNALMRARAQAARTGAPLTSTGAYASAASRLLGDPFSIDASGNVAKPRSVQVAERRAQFEAKLRQKQAQEATQKRLAEARQIKDAKARAAAEAAKTRLLSSSSKGMVTVRGGKLLMEFHNGSKGFLVDLNHTSSPQLYQKLVEAGMPREAAIQVARARTQQPFRTAADFMARAPRAAGVLRVAQGMGSVEVVGSATGQRATAPNRSAPTTARGKAPVDTLRQQFQEVSARTAKLAAQPAGSASPELHQRYNQLRTEYNRLFRLQSELARIGGKPLSNAQIRALPELQAVEQAISRTHLARDNALVRERALGDVRSALRGLRDVSAKTTDPTRLESIRREVSELVRQESRLANSKDAATQSGRNLVRELDTRIDAARKVAARRQTLERSRAERLVKTKAEGRALMEKALESGKYGKTRAEIFQKARAPGGDPVLEAIRAKATEVAQLRGRAEVKGPAAPRAAQGATPTRELAQKAAAKGARIDASVQRHSAEIQRAAGQAAKGGRFANPEAAIQAARQGATGPGLDQIRNLERQVRSQQAVKRAVQKSKVARLQDPATRAQRQRVVEARKGAETGGKPAAAGSKAPATQLANRISELNTLQMRAAQQVYEANPTKYRNANEVVHKARSGVRAAELGPVQNLQARMESLQNVKKNLGKQKVVEVRSQRQAASRSAGPGPASGQGNVVSELNRAMDQAARRVMRLHPDKYGSVREVMNAVKNGPSAGKNVAELGSVKSAYNQLRYHQSQTQAGAKAPQASASPGGSGKGPAAPAEGSVGSQVSKVNDLLQKEAARAARELGYRSPKDVIEAARSGSPAKELQTVRNLHDRMRNLQAQKSVKGSTAPADARAGQAPGSRGKASGAAPQQAVKAAAAPGGEGLAAAQGRFRTAMQEALATGKYASAGEVYQKAHSSQAGNAPRELSRVMEAANEVARLRGAEGARAPAPTGNARLGELGFEGSAQRGGGLETSRLPLNEQVSEANTRMQREASRVARENPNRWRGAREVIEAAKAGEVAPELEGVRRLRGEMEGLQAQNKSAKAAAKAQARGVEAPVETAGRGVLEAPVETAGKAVAETAPQAAQARAPTAETWWGKAVQDLGFSKAAPEGASKWTWENLTQRNPVTDPVTGRSTRGAVETVVENMGWSRSGGGVPAAEAGIAEPVRGAAGEPTGMAEAKVAEAKAAEPAAKGGWRGYFEGVKSRLGFGTEMTGARSPLAQPEPLVEARGTASGAGRGGFETLVEPARGGAAATAVDPLVETGRIGEAAPAMEATRVNEPVAETVRANEPIAEPTRSRWSWRADMWHADPAEAAKALEASRSGDTMWSRIKEGIRAQIPDATHAKSWDPLAAHRQANYEAGGNKSFVEQFVQKGAQMPVEAPIETNGRILEPAPRINEPLTLEEALASKNQGSRVGEIDGRLHELRGEARRVTQELVESGKAASPAEALARARAGEGGGFGELAKLEAEVRSLNAEKTWVPREQVELAKQAQEAALGKGRAGSPTSEVGGPKAPELGTNSGRAAETARLAETGKPLETARLTETGKPIETARLAETGKPIETARLAETGKPLETARLAETGKPIETARLTETGKPLETARLAETGKPIETARLAETGKPIETARLAETGKPIETARLVEPVRAVETAPGARPVETAALPRSTAGVPAGVPMAPNALGIEAPLPGALEARFGKQIVDVAKMSPSQLVTESGGMISAESAGKIAEVAAKNGGKLTLSEVKAAGVPAAELALIEKGAQMAQATRVQVAEGKLVAAADQMVASGKYPTRAAALQGTELSPLVQKLNGGRAAATGEAAPAELAKATEAQAKPAEAQAKAGETLAKPGFNAADPVGFHQAKALEYGAQIEALKASSGKGLLGRLTKFTNGKKIAALEAQKTFHEQKAAELGKADPAALKSETSKLEATPHQAKLIGSLKAELAKVDPSSRYGKALTERIQQLESTPGENFARSATHLVAIAIGTNLFFNVWRQLKEDGKVDFKKATEFLGKSEFWMSTAGMVGGVFVGQKVAQLTFWELLSTRVMGMTPLGGTFMRLLPAFAGGAIGATILGGGLQNADWALVGAHTLGSTLGTAIAISMLAAGPIGQLVGAIVGGFIAEKVLEMIRGEGPEAEAAGAEDRAPGSDGDARAEAGAGASGAFTTEDVERVFQEMKTAYQAYLGLESAGNYGEAASAYERYMGLKRQLDGMRQTSYAARR